MRLFTYITCSYLLKRTQWEKSQEVSADDTNEMLHSVCLISVQVSKPMTQWPFKYCGISLIHIKIYLHDVGTWLPCMTQESKLFDFGPALFSEICQRIACRRMGCLCKLI